MVHGRDILFWAGAMMLEAAATPVGWDGEGVESTTRTDPGRRAAEEREETTGLRGLLKC
jgi:hypothetical protein